MIDIKLDSAAPNSGSKPFNSDLDLMRSHYTCLYGGRLPHTDNQPPITSVVGGDIRINESVYLVPITINNASTVGQAAFDTFNTQFIVTGSELVTPTGNPGVVIARIFDSSIQLGAVNPDGTSIGELQFLEMVTTGNPAVDYAAAKVLIGTDAIAIVAYWTGVAVSDGSLVSWCLDKTNINIQGTIDFLLTGNITGLEPNPSDPKAPVTNEQFFSVIGDDLNDFGLNIQHAFIFTLPILKWDNYLLANPAFEYRIYRNQGNNESNTRANNPNFLIATVPSTTTTFTDPLPFAGWNQYEIVAAKIGSDVGQITSDRAAFTEYDNTGGIPIGYYGDCSDGSYVPGTNLERGRVYNFDDFVTSLPFNIVGDGTFPVVFVDTTCIGGIIDIQDGCIITAQFSNVEDQTAPITVGGVPVDVSIAKQPGGAGGLGGTGGRGDGLNFAPGGLGGAAGLNGLTGFGCGNGGGCATFAIPGVGGSAGQITDPTTGGGGGGGGGGSTNQAFCGLPTGHGGDAGNGGKLSEYQVGILFVTNAVTTISAGVQIIMIGAGGANGTQGVAGINTFCSTGVPVIPTEGAGSGGGAGGGGGGGGQDGGKFIIASNALVTNLAGVQNYNGGAGGGGGVGGAAGVNVNDLSLSGTAGAQGNAGQPGNAGGFSTVVIP